MSAFEDYNQVSSVYDKVRLAVGTDVVAGLILVNTKKKKKDIRILDAGCGTGNHAKALMKYGFCRISLLDACAGMLDKAREKLAEDIQNGHIETIVETTMPKLPFDSNVFDVVTFSLVLHHIESNPDGQHFPDITKTLHEARRVLSRDGLITIITITPFSMTGIWWNQFLPELTERYSKRFPSINQWENIFKECKLRCINKVTLLGAEHIGAWYFDAGGPLKEDWRKAVSYWAMATNDEINRMEEMVKQMKADGILEQWMRDNDKTDKVGTYTVLVCKWE